MILLAYFVSIIRRDLYLDSICETVEGSFKL